MSEEGEPARRESPTRAGVVANVAWLTGANVLARPVWFLFTTLACMRLLGVERFGEMISALALASSVTAITEFGTNAYSIREITRQPDRASVLFSNLMAGRVVLTVIGTVTLGLVGVALGDSAPPASALVLAAVYALVLRLVEYCRAVFQAFEVLRFDAASLLVEKALVVGLGMAGLLATRTASGVLGGMAAGVVLTWVWTVITVHRRFAPFRPGNLSLSVFFRAYRESFPIGVFSSATVLLLGSGAMLLEGLSTDEAVGLWGAAFRNIELLLLLPTLVCTAALPRLAGLHHRGDGREFWRVLMWSGAVIGAGTAVLSVVVAFLAEPLLLLLGGGEFGAAAPVLRLAIWAYPWMGATMLLTQALIYMDDAWFAAGALVAAALANVLYLAGTISALGPLAPAYGLIGAHVLISAAALWRLVRARHPLPS